MQSADKITRVFARLIYTNSFGTPITNDAHIPLRKAYSDKSNILTLSLANKRTDKQVPHKSSFHHKLDAETRMRHLQTLARHHTENNKR